LICTISEKANARWSASRLKNMMKTPVGLVTIALTAAILLAASLLIVTGTRGEIRAPATPLLRAK
jgi:hypothetical protein